MNIEERFQTKVRSLFLILPVLIFFSCNKIERYSKRLLKGDEWNVREVSIDGVNQQLFGTWYIEGDDIYNAVSTAKWKHSKYTEPDALFEWQFLENGKFFQLNYKQLCEECSGDSLDDLDYFAHSISGKYTVKKCSRKKMEFRSTETFDYSGKTVKIIITRK